MSLLNLAAAQTIITGALAHAQAQGAKPLAVIVLDAGGHPMAFARNDGASFYRLDIARDERQIRHLVRGRIRTRTIDLSRIDLDADTFEARYPSGET